MSHKNDCFPVAVISDVHGNRWALEAVLRDIDKRGIQDIINLGDNLTGPLDPIGTAHILMSREMLTVSGNDDYELFLSTDQLSASLRYTRDLLTPVQLEWIRSLPSTAVFADDIFVCHGDLFDARYLLEQVEENGVFLRSTEAIEASITGISQSVILSGHSHQARLVTLLSGKMMLNPGSVGLPAYTAEQPVSHVMESGSPHARYAILSKAHSLWQVEQVLIPYDWEHAASIAKSNQRPEWAEWLMTGRAHI